MHLTSDEPWRYQRWGGQFHLVRGSHKEDVHALQPVGTDKGPRVGLPTNEARATSRTTFNFSANVRQAIARHSLISISDELLESWPREHFRSIITNEAADDIGG
jgi:hypothetical protein